MSSPLSARLGMQILATCGAFLGMCFCSSIYLIRPSRCWFVLVWWVILCSRLLPRRLGRPRGHGRPAGTPWPCRPHCARAWPPPACQGTLWSPFLLLPVISIKLLPLGLSVIFNLVVMVNALGLDLGLLVLLHLPEE